MPERDDEPRRDRAPDDDERKQTRPADRPVRKDDDKPKRSAPGEREQRSWTDPDPVAVDEFRTIALDKLKVASAHAVARDVLNHARLDVVADVVTGQLVMRLQSYVLADHLAPATHTASFQRPASAWQHVKAASFPRLFAWFRRPARFTTEHITIDVENWATFPEPDFPYPEQAGPVRMMQQVSQRPYAGWPR